jgi:hypothetical protein
MKILAKVVAGIRLLSARMVARWIRGPDEWDASALSWVALLSLLFSPLLPRQNNYAMLIEKLKWCRSDENSFNKENVGIDARF